MRTVPGRDTTAAKQEVRWSEDVDELEGLLYLTAKADRLEIWDMGV